MIRRYAVFSSKYPLVHRSYVAGVILISIMSAYELLENENFFCIGLLLFSLISIMIFSKSSKYKQKYLHI